MAIMGLITKWLLGPLGPYIAGGVAMLLALSIGWAGIQGARLHHAKMDLAAARAALKDPATKRTWQAEAEERGRDLGTCKANYADLSTSLVNQTASIEALKAQGAADTAQATQMAADARKAATDAQKRLAALSKPPVGIDSCARATEAYNRIKGSL